MAAIGTVIFDLGGVLIDWNPRYLFAKLFDGDAAGLERFMREVWSDAWNLELDRGRPFAEGVAELSRQHPQEAARIAAFQERWIETIGGPLPETVEILEALAARRVPLYALTNWSAETFPLVRDAPAYGFLGRFERIFVSGELKLVKPDPAIFRHVIDSLTVPPDTCLFIDDNARNIDAARAAGLRVHHFQGAPRLRAELDAHGLLA
jgi:2-haloacid dehalogenase